MRILHTSDLHVGLARFGKAGDPWSRLADTEALLGRVIATAVAERVDLTVISGDLFDTRDPRPREWAVVTGFIGKLSEFCAVVIVDGNHDGAWTIGDEDSRTLQPLARTDWRQNVEVLLGPGVSRPVDGILIVSVPYPHRRAVTDTESGAALLDGIITTLHERARHIQQSGEPIIFAGHLTVAGSMLGSERAMRLEDDISLSPDVLDLFDYAALGHIHRQQRVSRKAWYAGAPSYVDFGEAHDNKGFLVVDVERDREPVVRSVPSGDRPMWVVDWTGGERGLVPDPVEGSIIRVRVSSPEDGRVARDVLGGAHYLQVEVIAPATVVAERAMPADTAPTDALRAYLADILPEGTVLDPYMDAASEYMAA